MRTGTRACCIRDGILLPVVLLWLVLAAACGSGQNEAHDRQARKDSKKPMSTDYVRKYADARRSSFLDITLSSRGEVAWQVPLHENEQAVFSPEALLVSGGHLVVYGNNRIVGFDIAGKRLWMRAMRTGSPISIFDGKLFFRENGKPLEQLSAVTLGGAAVEREMYVLDAYEAAMPIYIEPLADGFLAMCVFIPMPEEGEGETSFYKKEYETLDYRWVAGFKGNPRILPLYIGESERLIVFAQEKIGVYNATPGEEFEDEEEIAAFDYPAGEFRAASCDVDGNLYLLGIDGGRAVLVVLSGEGEELWRWREGLVLPAQGDIQPPVLGPDNLVHLASGKRVMTLAEGKSVRMFETDGEMVSHVTVLAGGALLIAAESALYALDGDGKTVYSLEFDERVAAPPVAGGDGSVYVATARTLTRIE